MAQPNANTPMLGFFDSYPDFQFNPEASYLAEFNRLAIQMGWKPPTSESNQNSASSATGTGQHSGGSRNRRRRRFTLSDEEKDWNQNMPQQRRQEYKAAQNAYRRAITGEFNVRFGKDETLLDNWQSMCLRLGVEPAIVPNDISGCKKLIRKKFVNLYDIVEGDRFNNSPQVFKSLHQLRRYTGDTGKYFPKVEAKAGGILKFFLKTMFGPIHRSKSSESARN